MAFRERAIPSPAQVMRDPQQLSDQRRYDVPVTVIACEFSSAMLREWVKQGHPFVRELAKIREVEYVDLPQATGRSHPGPRSSGGRSSGRLPLLTQYTLQVAAEDSDGRMVGPQGRLDDGQGPLHLRPRPRQVPQVPQHAAERVVPVGHSPVVRSEGRQVTVTARSAMGRAWRG